MKGDSIHTFENGGKERGFFCMKLATFLSKEKEETRLDIQQYADLWETRFNQAETGLCHYRNQCPIYHKTLQKQNV